MPLVRAYVPTSLSSEETFIDKLLFACWEVVPAAFTCGGEGRLTPGSIEFIPQIVAKERYTGGAVVIDIEAYSYPEREANIDERCNAVKTALDLVLLNQARFKVWGKLVKAGWASDSPDPDFNGDMSMPAAIDRAHQLIRANL